MKCLYFGVCTTIIGVGLLLQLSVSASEIDTKDKKDKTQISIKKNTEKSAQKEETVQKTSSPLKKKSQVTNSLPIYKPPLRGAPAGRVAGGTRGVNHELPYLCLIVPEHIGLTISSQPILYFYQSKISPFPLEFTLIREQGITPIVETRIASPEDPGIQSVRLADYDVHLEPNIHYKWFIALVPDPQRRSKDILAAGGIEFIDEPGKIKDTLAISTAYQVPHVYAETGLWYDAFHALSYLIETSPKDPGLRKQRISLLQQIGLHQVADHDMTK